MLKLGLKITFCDVRSAYIDVGRFLLTDSCSCGVEIQIPTRFHGSSIDIRGFNFVDPTTDEGCDLSTTKFA